MRWPESAAGRLRAARLPRIASVAASAGPRRWSGASPPRFPKPRSCGSAAAANPPQAARCMMPAPLCRRPELPAAPQPKMSRRQPEMFSAAVRRAQPQHRGWPAIAPRSHPAAVLHAGKLVKHWGQRLAALILARIFAVWRGASGHWRASCGCFCTGRRDVCCCSRTLCRPVPIRHRGSELLDHQWPERGIALPQALQELILSDRIERAQLPQFGHNVLHFLRVRLTRCGGWRGARRRRDRRGHVRRRRPWRRSTTPERHAREKQDSYRRESGHSVVP